MSNYQKFFIDGAWVAPAVPDTLDVIDPATEQVYATVAAASQSDVDRAVAAAKAAFPGYSRTTRAQRLDLLRAILHAYDARSEDFAQALSREMGAPLSLARDEQTWVGRAHLESTITALQTFSFEEKRGSTLIAKEPIGVCALITPWNWPLNQIVCKVAPALATGCTMVLKPSEEAPINALVFAEVLAEAGVPAGVFNLLNGTGAKVGHYMSGHPDVDMVSFTGSTRAGIMVAKNAADTVKRVAQELGGKSPNIILPDADLKAAVSQGVLECFGNSGQSCNAPTRMLVPRDRHDESLAIAKSVAETLVVGDPQSDETSLGPVVNRTQFDKIQGLIQSAIDAGATLVTGGLGRPHHLNHGFYVRPTVFGNVTPDMTLAREEIFGPVLSIMSYADEAEAIAMANDTVFGLAAYVQSENLEHARAVARDMRAGGVQINYPAWDGFQAFGGYKQSGNGREYADFGMHEFLETKSIVGYGG